MRASDARPYGIACTSDETVGATIGRPPLPWRQCALGFYQYIYCVSSVTILPTKPLQSVTVLAHLITLPICVAYCPYGVVGTAD